MKKISILLGMIVILVAIFLSYHYFTTSPENSGVEIGKEFENAGVIEAIKNPWNPKWIEGTIAPCENVVWIISGTGEPEVEQACDLIINNSESFAYSCATVIANDTINEGSGNTLEQNDADTQNITATVVITRNLGSEIISPAQEVNLNNGSAMDALKKTAKVETAYGGGFVQAINGIKNTSKEAWFYYINGFLVNVGASAYQLQDGDVEQWDFHPYAGTMFIDALIGHFPQPFLNGYGGKLYPTVIVYQPGFESQAEALKDKLEELGVKDVAIKRSEELSQSEKESYNLILIGTAEHSLISELNSEYQKYKLPVHFESGKLIALTLESGEREFENAGVIQAIKNPWNPKWVEGTIAPCENVAWIISGTGELEAEEACDLIINNSESFAYSCAVVIANGTIMRVP